MEEKLSTEVLRMLDELDKEVYKKIEKDEELKKIFEEMEEEGKIYNLIYNF